MTANSALLTDTYTSPLRAQCGAAKRERSAAHANAISGNALRAHDSGNSPDANADGCLRPVAVIHGVD